MLALPPGTSSCTHGMLLNSMAFLQARTAAFCCRAEDPPRLSATSEGRKARRKQDWFLSEGWPETESSFRSVGALVFVVLVPFQLAPRYRIERFAPIRRTLTIACVPVPSATEKGQGSHGVRTVAPKSSRCPCWSHPVPTSMNSTVFMWSSVVCVALSCAFLHWVFLSRGARSAWFTHLAERVGGTRERWSRPGAPRRSRTVNRWRLAQKRGWCLVRLRVLWAGASRLRTFGERGGASG